MFKTFIDVAIFKKAPEWPYIIRDVIEIDNGWEISAFIPRRKCVRIYFSYRWYQFIDMLMLKRAVKNYEKQYQYFDTSDLLEQFVALRSQLFSENCAKAIAGLANAGIIVNKEELK
nr:MAG TPA: hypothetical protein [Caudoviricetes sp.]